MEEDAPAIIVKIASTHDMPEAIRLLRAIEAEARPDDPAAPDQAEAGFRQSLAQYDFMRSDACWLLLAKLERQAAGYAVALRMPKLDARHGFLYVDELYVLKAYRRRGIAIRLLEAARELAGREGYAGVRLLVRPTNTAARALYKRLDYVEHRAILGELRATNPR